MNLVITYYFTEVNLWLTAKFFILQSWFQSGLSEGKISLVVSFLGLENLSLLYTNISMLPQREYRQSV